MFPDETQPENQLERSTPLSVPPAAPDSEVQRKRMLIALGILLLALVAVVLKDWDFWFPPDSEAQQSAVRNKTKAVAGTPAAAPAATSAIPAREHKSAKATAPVVADAPFSATTERAALPPLQVEVVAGNRHMNVASKNNAIHLDVNQTGASSAAGSNAQAAGAPASSSPTTAAGNHVQLSAQTAQSVSVSVPPDYPLLARQMKVQGAVSLQALISRDGSIQELEILSGPGILAAAAREAVKQWHFKPYLQNGQPVETQARITVNFTISTN